MPLKNTWQDFEQWRSADINAMATQVNFNTINLLQATATLTSAYTAQAGDLALTNASGGAFTVTLVAAPANNTRIAVKKMDSSANAVTIASGAGDVFGSGNTTMTLVLQYQAMMMQYNTATATWNVITNDVTLAALDARYPTLSTITTKGDLLAATGSGALVRLGVGSDAQMLIADSTQSAGMRWGRITPRINSTASSATPAINTDITDQFNITALATPITSMTSGLTGTPMDGQKLMVRFKDNGSPQAITWGASFASTGVATLLGTTVGGKYHYVGLIWNNAASTWDCVAVDATGR